MPRSLVRLALLVISTAGWAGEAAAAPPLPVTRPAPAQPAEPQPAEPSSVPTTPISPAPTPTDLTSARSSTETVSLAVPTRPTLVARPFLEWSATAAGGALWFTTGTLIKPDIAPKQCRWCDGNRFDDELQSLKWSDPAAADYTSHIISYGLAPISASGLLVLAAFRDGRASELTVDMPILAEAVVAAGLVGEAIRFSTGRERPFVRALPAEEKEMVEHPEENNLSFVSGHAATSFSLAVGSGMIASLRGRRMAPIIWTVGLTLAATTSYLRIASHEHYVTDVVGGALIGAGVGLAAPLLHRPRAEHAPRLVVTPERGGALLLLVWR